MLLTRLRQIVDLLRPTARAMSWHPSLWAAVIAFGYVAKEASDGYIGYRLLVLRLAGLLICIAAAFVLDDSTEETLGYVPTPLVMRRGLRIALLLPLVSLTWALLVKVVGDVTPRDGGPMPVGDVTLEIATMLSVAFCASCLAARLTSDRLGGIAAAPVVLVLVAVAVVLPPDQRMILGSPSDPRWDDAHDWWRLVLVLSGVALLWLNGSLGSHRPLARVRALRRAPRPV